MADSMIVIALIDAASNCLKHGATAILTIRGGPQISGYLEKREHHEQTTAHVKTKTGWATVLVEEIVAVEARKD